MLLYNFTLGCDISYDTVVAYVILNVEKVPLLSYKIAETYFDVPDKENFKLEF